MSTGSMESGPVVVAKNEVAAAGVVGVAFGGSVAGVDLGLPIGTLIGDKYRVERVLGAGATGIVLAARHAKLDELVAVKCIRAATPWSSDVLARFAREAKTCARLRSEHIAKVIDVGVSQQSGRSW